MNLLATGYNNADLPMTGLDVWPAVAIGLVFLVAGCLGALWSATR